MLIWTNFKRFCCYISNISRLLRKCHFPIQVVLNLFANTKGSGTSFQVAIFVELYDRFFSFVIWHKLTKFH